VQDDVEGVAQMFCALPLSAISDRGGALRCNQVGCTSAPWSNASLARSLSAAQFTLYVDKLRELSENRVLVEQRQLREAELAQLQRLWRGEMKRDEEIALHRRLIRDDLLCLRCPRARRSSLSTIFELGDELRSLQGCVLRVVFGGLRR
jgi:hypothetical protein